MKKTKLMALLAGVLALATLLSACGTSSSTTSSGGSTNAAEGTKTTEYKYGEIDIPGLDGSLCGAPIYIAYEKGFFAEEGFDVNLISADTETRKIGLNNGTTISN